MTDEVQRSYARLRAAQLRAPTPSLAERLDWLERLERLVVTHSHAITEAIDADFGGRSRHESLQADVLLTLETVRATARQLGHFMERRWVQPSPYFLPSRAYVEPTPRGVVGIISPWNYPVNLALAPLAAALAAGNRALLKPSELTPATSALLARAVRDTYSPEEVVVLEGGPEVAIALCGLPLDHLLFTGSTAVGKKVAEAAAKNLVPVTLELGGKSPVLVMPEAPLPRAAERIAIGKLYNAGQTCIAPDYVLAPRGRELELLEGLRRAAREAYPRPGDGQYSSIVNARHHERLLGLLEDAKAKGARVEPLLSDAKLEGRVMAPVAVLDTTPEMRISEEEIFGPILPIIGYGSVDEAIARVAAGPKPLAFYCFDEDLDRASKVLARVPSGGACINDTMVHFAQEELPFGGVGASGMGAYHGRAGFEAFSHLRGVLVASALSPARRLQAPPYGRVLDAALEVLIKGPLGAVGARLKR